MAVGPTEGAATRPLAATTPVRAIAPTGDTADESIDRLNRLEVGRQFPAQILSRFNDGTFLLRLADINLRVALPSGGNIGDELAMTLLNNTPRPTFSLDSQSSTGTSAAPATLSKAGQLIADLLTAAKSGDGATSLVGKSPLMSGPGANAPQLASALQDTLSASGLFYESHVAQWADGKRPLADLLREPQARNGTASAMTVADADQAIGAREAGSTFGTTLPNPAELSPQVLQNRRNLAEYFSAAPLPVTNAPGAVNAAALDPGLAQLVGLQLNVLEQQRVQWQGEPWPGQAMTWEVSRDEESGGHDADDPARQNWQSVVSFTLPSLGAVSATIDLRGNHVKINLRTHNDDSAATLRRHSAGLADALEAAGSVSEGIIVRREAITDNDKQ